MTTTHAEALRLVGMMGRVFRLSPEIVDTLRRAIREPMEPAGSLTEGEAVSTSRRIVDFKVYQESDGLHGLIIALADDGLLWSSNIDPRYREWSQFPHLPAYNDND